MTAVVVVPCLSVERAHRRECWRCLVGQGYDKDLMVDDVVAGLLWRARALPVVVDILSTLDLFEVRFEPAIIEVLVAGAHLSSAHLQGPAGAGGLVMLAWRRDDELCVEVLVAPAASVDDGSVVDAALVRLAFPFRLVRATGEEDITAEDMKIGRPAPSSPGDSADPVRVRRFSMGKT